MWTVAASFLAGRHINGWSLEKCPLPMKVLVTGGAGFIGSPVVDLYLEWGQEVVIVDDLSMGRQSNLNTAARIYKRDIRSPDMRHGAKIYVTQH